MYCFVLECYLFADPQSHCVLSYVLQSNAYSKEALDLQALRSNHAVYVWQGYVYFKKRNNGSSERPPAHRRGIFRLALAGRIELLASSRRPSDRARSLVPNGHLSRSSSSSEVRSNLSGWLYFRGKVNSSVSTSENSPEVAIGK